MVVLVDGEKHLEAISGCVSLPVGSRGLGLVLLPAVMGWYVLIRSWDGMFPGRKKGFTLERCSALVFISVL